MKFVFGILALAVAGALGYVAEPSLRSDLEIFFRSQPEASKIPEESGSIRESEPEVVQEPEPDSPVEAAAPESDPFDEEASPEPEPSPEVDPAIEESSAVATPEEIVRIMQDSVRDAQVKEFSFDQVLEWNHGENETVDGQEFQTGSVSYKAETIFGVKMIQAKALIQNGRVLRWIWPKSGMEIQ